MKAIILAAGNGTRLYPLTENLPKPLIKINGKSVLARNIEKLLEIDIKDIGIVIQERYQEMFENDLSDYQNINIEYIYQKEQKGISHAIWASRVYLKNEANFITVLGDNLIMDNLQQFKEAMFHNDCVLAVARVDKPEDYGIIIKTGRLKIIEKPKNPVGNLAAMGIYGFNHHIFKAIGKTKPSERGEYEITDSINLLSTIKYRLLFISTIDIGTFERLEMVESLLNEKGV